MAPSLGDRLAGAIWGHLIGDAVGVAYEFGPSVAPADVRFGATGSHGQPPGTWSDDGALMLALLDSLLENGFDTTDQARRALAWYRDGAYTPDGDGRFDVGRATARALERFARGAAAEEAGADDEALGNGSLMRILPLPLAERETPDRDLVDHAHRVSKVTHGARQPEVACALYALIARRLLVGHAGRSDLLADSRAVLRSLYRSDASDGVYLTALDELEGWTDRSGRGHVIDSFWSAWDAFAGADSYAEAIRRAVGYGNDTDTTAAICGGLAGIHWGYDGIPAEWLAGMRGREIARPLVAWLLASAGYRTDDIRVEWVSLGGVPALRGATGRLGMTFLPGKRYPGRGGDHWRELEADAGLLRAEHGVDTLLLLVEDRELDAAQVVGIADVMAAHGIELLRHPIVDFGVPSDPEELRVALRGLMESISTGRRVAVACMGGLGRTGTVVACLLLDAGLDAAAAIDLTRTTRRGAIETDAQLDFVRDWSAGQ